MAADRPSRLQRWALGLGDGALAGVQALTAGGFYAGGAVAVAMGKFLLGGALAALGIGVFLRFKRLRQRARR